MKGDNIATRLRHFAADVIRLCRRLPDDPSAKHVARQLVRAATGGGANYEEARGAESRADFIRKVGIANKEMREALDWLRLAQDATLVIDANVEVLVREADEWSLSSPARSRRQSNAKTHRVAKRDREQ